VGVGRQGGGGAHKLGRQCGAGGLKLDEGLIQIFLGKLTTHRPLHLEGRVSVGGKHPFPAGLATPLSNLRLFRRSDRFWLALIIKSGDELNA